jgi:hypothetical protein
MVRINYNGFNKKLRLAVNNVNNLLQQEYFYKGIQRHTSFDMADITPSQLAGLMQIADFEMKVDLYYSIFPFNNVLAADNRENVYCIRMNKWNINRPIEVLCNAVMHQCVHAVNAHFPQFNFGHGDNSAVGKENTAPFWIATLAESFIAADNSIYSAMATDEVTTIPFLHNFVVTEPRRLVVPVLSKNRL